MKQMMKDLEAIYSQYTDMTYSSNKVPIYNINSKFSPKWKPINYNYNQLLRNSKQNTTETSNSERHISEVMKAFVNVQKPVETLMKDWRNQKKKSIDSKIKEGAKKEIRKAKTG